jgi:hypothetical protein
MRGRKDDYGRGKDKEKDSRTEITEKTIEATRIGGIFQTSNIQKGRVDQTILSPWLARQKKSFQNSGGSKTLRICIVFGTRKETTQQEITESSLIGTQEKEKIRKKR